MSSASCAANGTAGTGSGSRPRRPRATELLAAERADLRRQDLAPPGLAEYIDLLAAVTAQRREADGQIELLERTARFALRKHPAEPRR
jgi:hypothetical protein